MDSLFEATVQATEEAVVNAMVAAKTMTGINGHTVEALPHDRLREVLKKYNRLTGNEMTGSMRHTSNKEEANAMKGFLLESCSLSFSVIGGYLLLKKGYMIFRADQPTVRRETHFAMAAVDASTDRHAPESEKSAASRPRQIW